MNRRNCSIERSQEDEFTTSRVTKREAMQFGILLPLLVASLVQAAPTDTNPMPDKGPGVYYTKGNGTVSGTVEDLFQELLERNSPETVDTDQEEKTGER